MALPINAQQLVAKLRQIVRIVRRGPREVAVATIAGVLFMAGAFLPKVENMPTVLKDLANTVSFGLYVAGGLLLTWVVYRIWHTALPPPLPSPEIRPTVVKGPMAFGPEDGVLFRRLGREDELAQLLSLVLDDQVPLVVVMGESGVGKTSLLRAGLSHILVNQDVQYIYWEAIPNQSPERLLYAIQEQWRDNSVPQSLEAVLDIGNTDATRRVIILDQFEQLHPDDKAHQSIFGLLRRVATMQMPPHRITWIVAFRREYDPFWRDFELTMPDSHPPMLSMRLFSETQAKEVLAALADASDLTLDEVG